MSNCSAAFGRMYPSTELQRSYSSTICSRVVLSSSRPHACNTVPIPGSHRVANTSSFPVVCLQPRTSSAQLVTTTTTRPHKWSCGHHVRHLRHRRRQGREWQIHHRAGATDSANAGKLGEHQASRTRFSWHMDKFRRANWFADTFQTIVSTIAASVQKLQNPG